jgi:predicted metal-dependent phosphoesterase TrpH
VERQGPSAAEGIRRIAEGGGLPVLAHPIRLGIRDLKMEEQVIGELRDAGLRGLEVYHSDHRASDMARYAALAKELDLAVTGGSDFHGTAKPAVSLGTGVGRALSVPREVLERLRAA